MTTTCQILGTPQCDDGSCGQCRLAAKLAKADLLSRALKVLREVEWTAGICQSCFGDFQYGGHETDCALARVLAEGSLLPSTKAGK